MQDNSDFFTNPQSQNKDTGKGETKNGRTLGEVIKNETEKLVIAEKEYKGRKYIDMRIHFLGDNGAYIPTKKGVTFSPKYLEAISKILSKGIKL